MMQQVKRRFVLQNSPMWWKYVKDKSTNKLAYFLLFSHSGVIALKRSSTTLHSTSSDCTVNEWHKPCSWIIKTTRLSAEYGNARINSWEKSQPSLVYAKEIRKNTIMHINGLSLEKPLRWVQSCCKNVVDGIIIIIMITWCFKVA